jgi:hypothetical protein
VGFGQCPGAGLFLEVGFLARLLLELAGDVTKRRAEIRPHYVKGGDRCYRDQCRDYRIFDSRNTRFVAEKFCEKCAQ